MPSRPTSLARILALTLAAGLVLFPLWWRSSARSPASQAGGGAAMPPGGEVTDFASAPFLRAVSPPPADPGILLPGLHRITDVHASTEGWALLDGREARVVLLDPTGRMLRVVGREGQGPGELSGPAHVARRGLEVAVLDLAGTRLDRFGPDGDPLPRVHLARAGCGGTLAEELAPFQGAWAVLRRCTGPGAATAHLLQVEDDGLVEELAVDSLAGEATDPFLRPLLLADEGLYLGSTQESCFRRVSGRGPSQRCVVRVPRRAVPADFRRALEGSLAARARSVGLRLQVPEHLPPLLSVRSLAGGTLAARRPVDQRDAPWVVESQEALWTLDAVDGVRAEPGPAGVLLLRDDLEGIRVWVVPFEGIRP